MNANPTPVLTVPGRQLAIYGSRLSFNVTAASGLGATLYLSAPSLPSGAFFNGSSGAFAWTPDFSQKGSWTVSFTAIDLHGNTATKTVSIEVGAGRPKIERVVQAAGNSTGLVLFPAHWLRSTERGFRAAWRQIRLVEASPWQEPRYPSAGRTRPSSMQRLPSLS